MKEEMMKKAEEIKKEGKALEAAVSAGELSDDNLDEVTGGIASATQQIFAIKQEKR